ncbi:putative Gly-rich membrane protein Bcell_0380 [Montipora foliosa]|uniref:putative Gly-rich membrane protein Bcell_0380 n=1 Tax=Montipora foliosa TaxID=591990 RepID=UPI0035F1A80F
MVFVDEKRTCRTSLHPVDWMIIVVCFLTCIIVGLWATKFAQNQEGATEIKHTVQEMKTQLASMETTLQTLKTQLTNTQTQVGTDQKNTKAEIQARSKRSLNTQIQQLETKIIQEITALKSCACPDSGKTQPTFLSGKTQPTVLSGKTQPTVLPPGPGTGTMQDPYKIATVSDLEKLRTVWRSNAGKYFIVTQDIDLYSIANFAPLPEFRGILDGNNKRILNLRLDRSQIQYDNYASLFTGIRQAAVVKNLNFENVDIKGNRAAAALATYNYGTVDNCYVTGQVSSADKYGRTGGLVSKCWTGSVVKNSYSTARVSGNYYSGGLVASMYKATVEKSYATGTVSVVDGQAGGLVALMSSGVIRQSYATGSVSAGKYYAGGLVALVNTNPQSLIENCYANGTVSAFGIAGGLVGDLRDKVKNSYSSGTILSKQSRVDRIGALAGDGRGTIINSYGKSQSGVSDTRGQKTDTELKNPSTFSSWDKNIWKIESGKYPQLKGF